MTIGVVDSTVIIHDPVMKPQEKGCESLYTVLQ
jgi:hypothetical protein